MKNIVQPVQCGGFFFLVFCLFTTTNPMHAQWVQVSKPVNGTITSITANDSVVYAGTDSVIVYQSKDGGLTWSSILRIVMNPHLESDGIYSLASDGSTILGAAHEVMFWSTDEGQNWSKKAFTTSCIRNYSTCNTVAIMPNGTGGLIYFAGIEVVNCPLSSPPGFYYGIHRSTDSGSTWSSGWGGSVETFAVDGSRIVAGNDQGAIFLSTDYGSDWTMPVPYRTVFNSISSIAISGPNILADGKISTDSGATWANTGLGYYVNSFCVRANKSNDSIIFAGIDSGGVFLSTNNGLIWRQINDGLVSTSVRLLTMNSANIFAVTGDGSVWRRPLSEMITSVEKHRNDLPTQFSLHQNFPNPFNPSTTILFTLPSRSFVTLKVFDLLGQEVASIVSQEMSAGSYSRQWNAANMSSGIYFYRLQAGSFIQTRKLALLR